MDEDIAQKYIRDHERREAEIAKKLREAGVFEAKAKEIWDSNPTGAMQLEIVNIRRLVEAMMISFQIGEPDPEDEPTA